MNNMRKHFFLSQMWILAALIVSVSCVESMENEIAKEGSSFANRLIMTKTNNAFCDGQVQQSEVLRLLHTEVIMDMSGHIIDTIVSYDESLGWHINTGESIGGHHIWDYSNTYYTFDRRMFVGW